jgi:hypothetical protein
MRLRPEIMEQKIAILETLLACVVKQCGGEVRVPMADIEEPPEIDEDSDPYTGEWVFKVKGE